MIIVEKINIHTKYKDDCEIVTNKKIKKNDFLILHVKVVHKLFCMKSIWWCYKILFLFYSLFNNVSTLLVDNL